MIFVILLIVFFILIIIGIIKTGKVIPHRTVGIVERMGKYHKILNSGFNIILPFIDKIAYTHSLKEKAIEVPQQICITKDNIPVEVDGLLYLQIVNPKSASYGINDYLFATIQITQTTMRSVIGKLDLDQTFEVRENINAKILEAVDNASEPWGVKVIRYEIKDIKPPKTINDAMEKQMRAEREKRAIIAQSEGERQSMINKAEGAKQEIIAQAEAKAIEIEKLSIASSKGIDLIAKAISMQGGKEAVSLKIAEQYIKEFGKLAKTNNTMIIPSNLSDLSSIIASATNIYKHSNPKELLKNLKTKEEHQSSQ
ncbi:MAG: Modulator of FtsH protease HflK [Candidatus Anoxychlamydiales bacterium]|nr:Modulator of FtsH protease HflK [Candidatus Anoxychlamydiales bacterium]